MGLSSSEVKCIWAAGAVLGEGPFWSETRNAVYWVDIKGQRLHRYDLDTGGCHSWPMPERIGWVVEREVGGLVIGLKSGFAFLNPKTLEITPIGDPEPEHPGNRLNDAKVDPWRRIWAGTMDDAETEPTGALYRLDPDLTWTCWDEGYVVSNGPAFSPDGKTLYHTSSATREIFAFDLGADGALSNKRLFLRFKEEDGYPDGITTDAEGGLWVAHWLGWRVSRFYSDGTLDRYILLPVARVTNLTFGGHKLDRLFVTTASIGATEEERRNQPLAGGLFELSPGVTGLPTYKFGG